MSKLHPEWKTSPRWKGITRPYSYAEVERLQATVKVKHTIAELGADKLWNRLQKSEHVASMGAMTGSQAVQMVRGGLEALYLSGWQVAADANLSGQTYPDQSLYPANSVPSVVKRINNALLRADQIEKSEGKVNHDWMA
ncbi:MAG: isocitrate lyase, partial [Bdellovibrionota bacterium]